MHIEYSQAGHLTARNLSDFVVLRHINNLLWLLMHLGDRACLPCLQTSQL